MNDEPLWAFPNSSCTANGFPGQNAHAGMTLRDWFAGQLIVGLAIQNAFSEKQVAEWAYAQADAMLAAREHGPAV